MEDTCKIFDCNYKALYRWIKCYSIDGNIKRKQTKKKSYKITNDITKYVLSLVKKNVNITRKRLRDKYYPEKREG